jgi:hypothetical protein
MLKNGFESILAWEGDHKGSPYKKRYPVGAGLVPALARTASGTNISRASNFVVISLEP